MFSGVFVGRQALCRAETLTLARGFCVAGRWGGGHVKWCHEVAKPVRVRRFFRFLFKFYSIQFVFLFLVISFPVSFLVLSCLVLSFLVMSRRILSPLVSSRLISSSCLVLSHTGLATSWHHFTWPPPQHQAKQTTRGELKVR